MLQVSLRESGGLIISSLHGDHDHEHFCVVMGYFRLENVLDVS